MPDIVEDTVQGRAQSAAHTRVDEHTAEARSANGVEAAQNAAVHLIQDAQPSTSQPDYQKAYMSQLNKELEDKKILPVLALAYVDKEFEAISKKDKFVDKDHIEKYIDTKMKAGEMDEYSPELMLLRKAEQLIGKKRFDEKHLGDDIRAGESSIQKLAVKDATSAAEVLTKPRKGGNIAGTLLDEIDGGGSGNTGDRRVSKDELERYLYDKTGASKYLDPSDREKLDGLVRDWDTPAIQAMLTEHAPGQPGYLSLEPTDSNNLNKYLEKQKDGQKSDDPKQTDNQQPKPTDSAKPSETSKPTDGAAQPKPGDTGAALVPIPAHPELAQNEQEDLARLAKAGYKLDPNDHGDANNKHSEVYKGPNGQVIAIDRDGTGRAVGYVEGNTNTGYYLSYRKFQDANATTGQKEQWGFYKGGEPQWTTGKVALGDSGKIAAAGTRYDINGKEVPEVIPAN